MKDKVNTLVTLEKEGEVSLVCLNDQGSFNSLSEDLLKELNNVTDDMNYLKGKINGRD